LRKGEDFLFSGKRGVADGGLKGIGGIDHAGKKGQSAVNLRRKRERQVVAIPAVK